MSEGLFLVNNKGTEAFLEHLSEREPKWSFDVGFLETLYATLKVGAPLTFIDRIVLRRLMLFSMGD